jgi:uncharacterized protein (TIGR00730 family)
MKIKALTVFCGSKSGNNPSFLQAATVLGNLLAQENIELVYGGGNKGLMGALANGCLDQGGKVIGIMPKLLLEWEAQHTGLTELIITENMHDRKKILYEKGDAGLVLPGGMGTLDELFEMLTWNNLKIHNKKVFILNIDGCYNSLIQLLENMDTNGFMYDNWKDRIIVCPSVDALKLLLS